MPKAPHRTATLAAIHCRTRATIAAVAGLALVAAGAWSLAARQAAAADKTEARPKIIAVSGPLFDPFFSALKKGIDDGAKAFDVDVQYVTVTDTNNIMADFAHLLQQSVSRHPAAIAVGDFFPDALDPIIRKATAEGIAVVFHNSGLGAWKQDGALGYVGEDATQMGADAGREEAAAGVRHGLCVNQVPGNPALEQRCAGFAAGIQAKGGTAKVLTIPISQGNNPTEVLQAIKGALQSDKTIDGIFTLGSAIAIDAVNAVKQVGRADKITIGTTDLSNADLEAVQNGEILFVIDQQPYLQGFDSIQIAAQYLRYGLHPVNPVITGPLLITKQNVADVLRINKQYLGIRGAS